MWFRIAQLVGLIIWTLATNSCTQTSPARRERDAAEERITVLNRRHAASCSGGGEKPDRPHIFRAEPETPAAAPAATGDSVATGDRPFVAKYNADGMRLLDHEQGW